MLADLPQLWSAASADPVLFYSLASALLLAVVSLYSGLTRRDVSALANPRTLLRVVSAVALAFVLRALAESTSAAPGTVFALLLPGLHRLPLYVVALAYGPTAGLIIAALFAAFASSTLLPGLTEAVLALELVVLGWLAIFPSPRSSRWAGPVNGALAYALAWGTAGIALLTFQGVFVTIDALLALHADVWPGVALGCVLLAAVPPGTYRKVFPGSRIAPRNARPDPYPTAVPVTADATLTELVRQDERTRVSLVQPAPDIPRVRARIVKSLGPYALPEDSFER
jgi:hypothetical protein